jgi:hypothetical protein
MVLLLCSGSTAAADDLTGADRFLCTPSQATLCVEDGEYAVDLPWNVNIPQFIEVDPKARRLATTEASGENRQTAIEHLHRADGSIVFHGFEMGRAFSWVIDEIAGHQTHRAKEEASQEVEQQNQQTQQATAEQQQNFKKAFSVCLEAKNYMVKY